MPDSDSQVNNQSIASGFNHSFDVGIAMTCGVEAAIVYNNLVFWIIHNFIEGKNLHKGTTWTYNTPEKMQIYIPYLTPRQIKYGLDKLYKAGVIRKDNFNKDKFDKTNWYALKDDSILEKSKKVYETSDFVNRAPKTKPSTEQICPIDRTNLSDPHNTYTVLTDTVLTDNTSSNSSNPKTKKKAESGGIFFSHEEKKFKNITQDFIDLMKATYPGIDVEKELLKMTAWLLDPCNPRRDGKQAFITKWLSKAEPNAQPTPAKESQEFDFEPKNAADVAFYAALKRSEEFYAKKKLDDAAKKNLEDSK